ncbi:MAG TPA: hypothetical protein VIK18_07835 [Pirellulales bacterium]
MARHDFVRCSRPGTRPGCWYALAAVAAVCTALGAIVIYDQFHGAGSSHAGLAGWVLVVAGLVQLRLASRLSSSSPARSPKFGRQFFLRLIWGVVACWVVCQLDGRTPSREKLLALAAAWYSLCLVPVVAPLPDAQWRHWTARLHLRGAEQAVVALAILLLVGEAALRSIDWAGDRRLAAREVLAGIKLAPGSQYRGRSVNRDGYCDEEFQPVGSAGQFRIAALGDETILSGDRQNSCLRAIEQRRPEVEVYNFAMPGCHPGHYAHQMRLDVARFHPDLVLAFISLGREIRPAPAHSLLSWQALSMARRLWRPPLAPTPAASETSLDYEAYLRLVSDRLLLCRTPLNTSAQQRWNELLGQLDRLATQCRQKHVALALVVVPADYQISPQTCQAAGRRIGCEADQFDLQLPQRRLIAFADEHDALVIDLLPHFRAATQPPFCRHQQQLSEYGHRIAGRVIADWLTARYTATIATAGQGVRR